jgi:hypothetical protein
MHGWLPPDPARSAEDRLAQPSCVPIGATSALGSVNGPVWRRARMLALGRKGPRRDRFVVSKQTLARVGCRCQHLPHHERRRARISVGNLIRFRATLALAVHVSPGVIGSLVGVQADGQHQTLMTPGREHGHPRLAGATPGSADMSSCRIPAGRPDHVRTNRREIGLAWHRRLSSSWTRRIAWIPNRSDTR